MLTAAEYPPVAVDFGVVNGMSDSSKSTFESRYGLSLGRDGEIHATDHNTAVKFFTVWESFGREHAAYQALAKAGITEVAGHAVLQLICADDELLAVEMTIVRPPFLLDFVSAYPAAQAPDFPEEVWDQWRQDKREEFGPRWAEVEFVLSEFRRLTGLVLLDVNRGNIRFTGE
jgi:hypothetical protein